jgi:hypothetical protein
VGFIEGIVKFIKIKLKLHYLNIYFHNYNRKLDYFNIFGNLGIFAHLKKVMLAIPNNETKIVCKRFPITIFQAKKP